jgi:predicted MFS family arabinose efflux permease
MCIFFAFGAHAFIWATTSATVRQRAVPLDLQGRVGSVNLVGVYGGLVIGSGIGGLLAQRWGVTAPFWFAFVGSTLFVALIWAPLAHVIRNRSRTGPVGWVRCPLSWCSVVLTFSPPCPTRSGSRSTRPCLDPPHVLHTALRGRSAHADAAEM